MNPQIIFTDTENIKVTRDVVIHIQSGQIITDAQITLPEDNITDISISDNNASISRVDQNTFNIVFKTPLQSDFTSVVTYKLGTKVAKVGNSYQLYLLGTNYNYKFPEEWGKLIGRFGDKLIVTNGDAFKMTYNQGEFVTPLENTLQTIYKIDNPSNYESFTNNEGTNFGKFTKTTVIEVKRNINPYKIIFDRGIQTYKNHYTQSFEVLITEFKKVGIDASIISGLYFDGQNYINHNWMQLNIADNAIEIDPILERQTGIDYYTQIDTTRIGFIKTNTTQNFDLLPMIKIDSVPVTSIPVKAKTEISVLIEQGKAIESTEGGIVNVRVENKGEAKVAITHLATSIGTINNNTPEIIIEPRSNVELHINISPTNWYEKHKADGVFSYFLSNQRYEENFVFQYQYSKKFQLFSLGLILIFTILLFLFGILIKQKFFKRKA